MEDEKENPSPLNDVISSGTALSTHEVVGRFGEANAEFIKGYRGMDNQTGQRLSKGLAGIAKSRVNGNPAEAVKNIKQQAGYSAEVAATSRDNAEAIINRSDIRVSLSCNNRQPSMMPVDCVAHVLIHG